MTGHWCRKRHISLTTSALLQLAYPFSTNLTYSAISGYVTTLYSSDGTLSQSHMCTQVANVSCTATHLNIFITGLFCIRVVVVCLYRIYVAPTVFTVLCTMFRKATQSKKRVLRMSLQSNATVAMAEWRKS